MKQQKFLAGLGLSFGKFLYLLRRGLTSFERRFPEEFEESFHIFAKNALDFLEFFLQLNRSPRVFIIPHLPVSMPHVEKLADWFVLLLPVYLLTNLGTVQGGLACSAVLELENRRCFDSADDAAPEGHDC